MKFLAVAVVATALAQVSAVPLSLLIKPGRDGGPVDGSVVRIEAIRFGHPVPPISNGPNFISEEMSHEMTRHHDPEGFGIRYGSFPAAHRPCGGARNSRFRFKAIQFANAIRKTFGLPLIEHHHRRPHHHHHEHHGHHDHHRHQPPHAHVEGGFVTIPSHLHPMDHHVVYGQEGFMFRLSSSLANLGPWEGRAVAFVLGCGLGVLLRMLWVLFIVGFRAIKGSRPEEPVYSQIILVEEHVTDVPPAYPEDKKETVEGESK